MVLCVGQMLSGSWVEENTEGRAEFIGGMGGGGGTKKKLSKQKINKNIAGKAETAASVDTFHWF